MRETSREYDLKEEIIGGAFVLRLSLTRKGYNLTKEGFITATLNSRTILGAVDGRRIAIKNRRGIADRYRGLTNLIESDGRFKLKHTDFAFDYVEIPSTLFLTRRTEEWLDKAKSHQKAQRTQLVSITRDIKN